MNSEVEGFMDAVIAGLNETNKRLSRTEYERNRAISMLRRVHEQTTDPDTRVFVGFFLDEVEEWDESNGS